MMKVDSFFFFFFFFFSPDQLLGTDVQLLTKAVTHKTIEARGDKVSFLFLHCVCVLLCACVCVLVCECMIIFAI